MTLETIEPDRAEMISLLQPFIDGELDDDERELVAAQVAANPEYQAVVHEQQQVRALLRSLGREAAPPALRERVLADLDAVDRERGASGWLAPVVGRIKAFGRGSMLMAPAAAAAVALFFVVRAGVFDEAPAVDGVHVDGGLANSLGPALPIAKTTRADQPPTQPVDRGLADVGEQGFAIQVAPPRSLPVGVALVSDDPQVSLSSVVRYRDGGGQLIVDTQRAARAAAPVGTRQVFRGHPYYLGRDGAGRVQVEFLLGPVHHSLVLHPASPAPGATLNAEAVEVASLLEVAEALRNAHGP